MAIETSAFERYLPNATQAPREELLTGHHYVWPGLLPGLGDGGHMRKCQFVRADRIADP